MPRACFHNSTVTLLKVRGFMKMTLPRAAHIVLASCFGLASMSAVAQQAKTSDPIRVAFLEHAPAEKPAPAAAAPASNGTGTATVSPSPTAAPAVIPVPLTND